MKKLILVGPMMCVLAACASSPSSSGSSESAPAAISSNLYAYNRLLLKDLDQMNRLVQDKIRQSRQGGDKIAPLREAMQAVYSRPNEDHMIEKIVNPLKNELDEVESWEPTMRSLVEEGVSGLRNPHSLKPEAQVTYSIMLENIMAELRPDADKPFERSVLVSIRDARIELTREAIKERTLRVMRKVKSPSEIASVILKDVEKAQKARAKEEKETIKSRSGQ